MQTHNTCSLPELTQSILVLCHFNFNLFCIDATLLPSSRLSILEIGGVDRGSGNHGFCSFICHLRDLRKAGFRFWAGLCGDLGSCGHNVEVGRLGARVTFLVMDNLDRHGVTFLFLVFLFFCFAGFDFWEFVCTMATAGSRLDLQTSRVSGASLKGANIFLVMCLLFANCFHCLRCIA